MTTQATTTIPLAKLVAWDGNVRRTGAEDGIDELAASIAAHGLLQSLVVKKDKRGKFAVVAGGRRLLALRLLAKHRTIESDYAVPCRVVSGEIDPAELSLAENVVRAPMHPADQFEAFRVLIDNGSSVADVAARFGVSEAIVEKRLKLGRLSPVILAAYREGGIGLEQAQAFALSDDHEAQERVFGQLQGRNASPHVIRRALTEGEVPASDKRVRFVGLGDYIAAGGAVRRDLFDQSGEDEHEGGYVLDEALLDRLVAGRLEQAAQPVRAEGWRWVEAVPEFGYGTVSDYGRRYPERAELPEADQAELDRLAAEYDGLVDSEDESNAERLEAIEQRIDELNARAETWPAETLAVAGALIGLDHSGEVRIERGLIRREDERAAKKAAKAATNGGGAGVTLPASLVADLTAQKTAILRLALAKQPDTALAAIVHTLAFALLYERSAGEATCLEIAAPASSLRRAIANPDGCEALIAFEREIAGWHHRLPRNPAVLWAWCLVQPRDTLLEVLALCAALTVNAVRAKTDRPESRRLRHADDLARAMGLDMAALFTPTAANFFGRVSRPIILAAIREAKGGEPAPAWAKMKKAELACVAERHVAGSGWLPEPVRIAEPVAEEPFDADEEEIAADDIGDDDTETADAA